MAELTTLARPYAKAAFKFALENSQLDQWSAGLGMSAQVVADEDAARVLSAPQLTADEKAKLVIDICGDKITDGLKNFLSVLSANHRLALLPEISVLFDKFKADQEQSINVDITSAFDLANEEQQKLAQALSQKFNREINVSGQTDKALIGGVVIRSGDMVIDGSVAGRLKKLAEAINS
ncbi:F0F1 ATP synthase subunit delta [Litoribrevibacter euphylliae]|uniref:ATP synthase subunit delta n=1 Tax=Litoribrevibacter euphylliae TaxID=1834034 RepID=A0ABV7HFQ2_9GAMM